MNGNENAKTGSAYDAEENKGQKDGNTNLSNANDLIEKKDKESKIRGKQMSIMNKLLSLSNSYNFYKSNYDSLKNRNIKLTEENQKLKANNKRLTSNLEKIGQYYQEKYQKQLANNQLAAESLENESTKE